MKRARVEGPPVHPERAKRVEGAPFDLELEPIDTTPDPSDDFDDDYTDPDPLSPFAPAWAPADIGQALLDEWDAGAATRAARLSLVARVLRSANQETAITSLEKLAVRPAS